MTTAISVFSKSPRFMAGDCKTWKLGPLELLVHRSRKEWRIGYQFDERPELAARRVIADPVEVIPDLDWKRWPASDDGSELAFTPVMPDRPLVVRPDAPLTLNPERAVDFFVSIPVWLSIRELGSKPQHFMEIPTRLLSDTWFGDPDEGELCYASLTSARRFLDEMDLRPNRVICPLQVRNDNDEPLAIERICLRAQYLEIYQGNQFLWTPEGRIIYHGINAANQVIFGRTGPNHDEANQQVGGRKGSSKRGFFARSLASATGGMG